VYSDKFRSTQWKERITSRELASSFGMIEKMAAVTGKHGCGWLGHLVRMGNNRILKQLLFGEFVKTVHKLMTTVCFVQ